MQLKPIGIVNNDIREPGQHGWENIVSELVLSPNLEEALEEVENFSHLIVLFWLHRISPSQRRIRKVHPRGREDLPLVGVFASRSPMRPNPIGMTVVKLLERQGTVLRVKGLDAIAGTPVLDIKPYLPWDLVPQATFPAWVSQIEAS